MRIVPAIALAAGCGGEAPPPRAPPPVEAAIEPPAPGEPAPSPAIPRLERPRIEPEKPTVEDDLVAKAEATDPGGGVADLDFQWFINGQVQHRFTTDRLVAGTAHRGDKVEVEVSAGNDAGETAARSMTVTVLNASPHIVTDPGEMDKIDGFVVEATDPDGDALTFRLDGAPAGMAIDPKSGELSYAGSETEKGGDYKVKVMVEDGQGGQSRWEFALTVNPGRKAEKVKAAAAQK